MPINASHEFLKAEREYLAAGNLGDRIYWLEEMIKTAPKHKGSENLLQGLRTRLKKFITQKEKSGKKGRGKKGIRKEGYQFVLVGKTNVGKSQLLSGLTGKKVKSAEYEFTTRQPAIGTFDYSGVKAQLIDTPSLGCEDYDSGLINGADSLIIVINDTTELDFVKKEIAKARGKHIVVINKIDLLDVAGLRKLTARMKSKRIDGVMVSAKTGIGIEELRERLFLMTGFCRIYMKEPGKKKHESRPMVMKAGSSVKDVAEHILKGFARRVKEVRLNGPSGKFPNQRVGLTHKIKDKDIIEFIAR